MAKKDMSSEELAQTYAQSQMFLNKIEAHTAVIRREINILSDPAVMDGMKGGAGNDINIAVKTIARSFDAVSARVVNIRKFVDRKVADLKATISTDHFGAKEVAQSAKRKGDISR